MCLSFDPFFGCSCDGSVASTFGERGARGDFEGDTLPLSFGGGPSGRGGRGFPSLLRLRDIVLRFLPRLSLLKLRRESVLGRWEREDFLDSVLDRLLDTLLREREPYTLFRALLLPPARTPIAGGGGCAGGRGPPAPGGGGCCGGRGVECARTGGVAPPLTSRGGGRGIS